MEAFSFLFYAGLLLISEESLAIGTIYMEIDFVWKLENGRAPVAIVQQRRGPFSSFQTPQRG
jgi:hypothetical protein